jgi:hypothetical protein
MNSNPAHGEVYSIQHYVIKFVSDLRQIGDFLPIHQETVRHFVYRSFELTVNTEEWLLIE